MLRNSYSINGEEQWRYKGPKPSMYDVEHKELYAAIRSGKTINNGDYMCKSTMLAIMGREVSYTGKTLTWEQMMNSKQDMTPAAYEWSDIAVPEVARPGKTPFV